MSIFSTFNMLTWKQTDAFTLTLTKYDHNNESAVEQRSFYVIWTSEEISMLKSCQYCQKIHDSKYNCHMKPVKRIIGLNAIVFVIHLHGSRKGKRLRNVIDICVRYVFVIFMTQQGSLTAMI